ncbi:MAG: hypothetical protein K8R23_19185 [Chthoniobacter sp.]|nr:hypothetical protein [Chthoniobacter sp.]
MRSIPLLLCFLGALAFLPTATPAATAPFEILAGDRVLFLGDALLEREGTYGYLETRMHEQFADRSFTVRNLSFAGDTPLGVSRASFDPPAKGRERLREQLDLVKPTVVFLGYGMAASLQELTDKSGDATLNPDPARYGAEPMSAARFKKELGQLMDTIVEKAKGERRKPKDGEPAVRFVLLSPIRHEDLRASRPGLPDPAEHNKLLAEYSKAIQELAKERGARFVDLSSFLEIGARDFMAALTEDPKRQWATENGIHLTKSSHSVLSAIIGDALGWDVFTRWFGKKDHPLTREQIRAQLLQTDALRAAIIRKNELLFHQLRLTNSPDLVGVRRGERGQMAKETAQFDSLIAEAEAEIDRLKRPAINGQKEPQKATSSVPDVVNNPQNLVTHVTNASPGSPEPVPHVTNASPDSPEPVPHVTNASPGSPEPVPRSTNASPDSPEPVPRSTNASPDSPAPVPHSTNAPPVIQAPAAPLPLPTFTVADGYQIELWAENPMSEKPTQMNWDAAGRLWVATTTTYPQIAPGQVADDQILILSDPTGSGKATKSEVFAEGLRMPMGVVPDLQMGNGEFGGRNDGKPRANNSENSALRTPHSAFSFACYIAQGSELLHIDAAGKKRIILSGFGTEDAQHLIHTLRWGPDGRLYFNQGSTIHSHLETPWGMVRLNSGGCLAYDPRTERTEVFAKGWVNSWGHAWDRWGQSFFTDAAGGDGLSWAFPGATFANCERARQTMPGISPGVSPKFCGLELIYSPHFPADWQGCAVTCDLRAHRVVRLGINDLSAEGGSGNADFGVRNGEQPGAKDSDHSALRTPHSALSSAYTTSALPDLVRTDDASFSPIDVKMGPDGALYVADWSNPIINHGEVAFRNPRRDHHSGRIWRISKKDTPPVKWEPLAGKKTGELMDKLLSENLWEKEQARRVLQVRDFLASTKDSDALLSTQGSVERVAEAFGIPRFGSYLGTGVSPNIRALAARYLGIRYAVLSAAGQDAEDRYVGQMSVIQSDLLPKLIADPNPRVRLEAMRALARIPTGHSAELILDAAMKNNGDVFLDHAAWLSINELAKPWTDAIASGAWKSEGREAQLDFGLKALPADLSRATLARVLADGKADLAKGPWIDLIGHSGGPDELRRLYEMLLVSYGTECCPDPAVEALQAAPVNDTDALRILAALTEAARVRGVRPSGSLATLERLILHTKDAVRAASVRLVGYWKPAGALRWLETALADGQSPLNTAGVQNAIESMRDLGGAPAIALLQKLAAADAPAPRRQQAAPSFTFFGELGKPGLFDASKASVARVWRLYPGAEKDAALKGAPSGCAAAAFTRVDGRLTKAHLEKALQFVTKPGKKIWAVTQFNTATAGLIQVRLDFNYYVPGTAPWIDGKPVGFSGSECAIANFTTELPAGLHTLAVELDVQELPPALRASSVEAGEGK